MIVGTGARPSNRAGSWCGAAVGEQPTLSVLVTGGIVFDYGQASCKVKSSSRSWGQLAGMDVKPSSVRYFAMDGTKS